MNCCDEFTNECTQGPGCPLRCEKVMQTPLIQKNSDGTDPSLPVVAFPSPRQWLEDMARSFLDFLVWLGVAGIAAGFVAVKLGLV